MRMQKSDPKFGIRPPAVKNVRDADQRSVAERITQGSWTQILRDHHSRYVIRGLMWEPVLSIYHEQLIYTEVAESCFADIPGTG